jgi:hypothetical protein
LVPPSAVTSGGHYFGNNCPWALSYTESSGLPKGSSTSKCCLQLKKAELTISHASKLPGEEAQDQIFEGWKETVHDEREV